MCGPTCVWLTVEGVQLNLIRLVTLQFQKLGCGNVLDDRAIACEQPVGLGIWSGMSVL